MSNAFAKSSPLRYAGLLLVVVGVFAAAFFISRAAADSTRDNPAASNSTSNPATVRQTPPAPSGFARVDPPFQISDFTLINTEGQSMRFTDLRGKAALLFFGYTNCPLECPATLADFTRIKRELGADAEQMNFVFISVDGRRDTPPVIRQYLSQFDPQFIGLTGTEETLRALGLQFNLVFEVDQSSVTINQGNPDSPTPDPTTNPREYFLQHTSPSFFVDADGRLLALFFYGTQPETVANGIRSYL